MIRDILTRVRAEKEFVPIADFEDVDGYYRMALERLIWPPSGESRPPRTLGVTSCYDGEGVSTVAAQLATTAAGIDNRRVLLVDGNLAGPSLDGRFGIDRQPGFADLLLELQQEDDVVRPSELENLALLPAGEVYGSLCQVGTPERMDQVVASLAGRFDLVVFDLPPADSHYVVDLARRLDGVLLVVESERVPWEVAQRTRQRLADAKVHLVGAILNKTRHHVPAWLDRGR
jgi:Mrp family chromosome partitioning ATPase